MHVIASSLILMTEKFSLHNFSENILFVKENFVSGDYCAGVFQEIFRGFWFVACPVRSSEDEDRSPLATDRGRMAVMKARGAIVRVIGDLGLTGFRVGPGHKVTWPILRVASF